MKLRYWVDPEIEICASLGRIGSKVLDKGAALKTIDKEAKTLIDAVLKEPSEIIQKGDNFSFVPCIIICSQAACVYIRYTFSK